ncbi:3-deoxy-D-manno-octulosonic acid kinase [Pseudoalteromonas sp. SSM20]|uniref:3-deoxy-D-manno-octulosonic acid kinase n=1 Tax=Pseudoalteromonas sp. SSM20 TaxID=3139394 RepID=UPI003BA94FAE
MLSIKHLGSTSIITPKSFNGEFDASLFDVGFLARNDLIRAEKKGRATTYFFNCGEKIGVLRHYWRGGLIGKLLSDQYAYFGLKNTRTYKEFALLVEMKEKGLPVPSAIAAKVTRRGLIYRGDIITEALPNSQSVLDILKTRSLCEQEIVQIAETIASFHNHGVNHADLNINNILISNKNVYLIDFDRGTLGAFNAKRNQNNIERLARSFAKEKHRNSPFYWQENDWQVFLEAYKSALKAD